MRSLYVSILFSAVFLLCPTSAFTDFRSLKFKKGFSVNSAVNSSTQQPSPTASFGELIADVNSDGHSDFVAADQPGYLSIRLENGSGDFGAARLQKLAGSSRHSLAQGDINHDAKLDLVAVGGGKISVLIGQGNGNFVVKRVYLSEQTLSVALADLNSDGLLDLVSAGATAVVIRLGNGNGTFNDAKSFKLENGAGNTLSIKDINADGGQDVLVTGSSSNATVLLGDNSGGFRGSVIIALGISAVHSHVLEDLNDDGFLDLIVSGSSKLISFLGTGDGKFSAVSNSQLPGEISALLADLNIDGKLDVVASSKVGFSVGLGMGNGSFFWPVQAAVPQSTASNVLLASDIDGDGIADIFVSGLNSSGIGITTIKFGQGNATFHPTRSVSFINGVPSQLGR